MMRRDGFVLIAALWLVVALSAVGLDAALRSQPRRLAAANQLDIARAREAAFAGTEYARSRLTSALLLRAEELRAQAARMNQNASRGVVIEGFALNANRQGLIIDGRGNPMTTTAFADDPWRDPQGLMPAGMQLGDAQFTLDVHDTGLAVNINQVTDDELRAFLSQGMRLDYALADRLTQAMLDWRDTDELPRINGGEREQYIKEDLPVLPPNRPFADVNELRNVMGMTAELFAALRPYVTVVGSGRINVNAAPEPVLMAIPSFTPAVAAQLVRRRSAGQFPRNLAELRAIAGNTFRAPSGAELTEFNRLATYGTNEVEIVAYGGVPDSPIQAVVRVIVARSNTAAIVTWRRFE